MVGGRNRIKQDQQKLVSRDSGRQQAQTIYGNNHFPCGLVCYKNFQAGNFLIFQAKNSRYALYHNILSNPFLTSLNGNASTFKKPTIPLGPTWLPSQCRHHHRCLLCVAELAQAFVACTHQVEKNPLLRYPRS